MVKDGFKDEIMHADSDVLLFHFLGLDHIGHAFSARKDLVDLKLEEMDSFVAELQDWIANEDAKSGRRTLTLVMGDHGMTLDGNHGGGSPEETRAAAVFLAPKLNMKRGFTDWEDALNHFSNVSVHQEDIAATLTSLLDSNKPLTNGFGKLIPEVVNTFSSSPAHFYHNLIHLLRFPFKKQSRELDLVFHEILNSQEILVDDLVRWSGKLKHSIDSVGFQYNDKKLIGALIFMALIACASLIRLFAYSKTFQFIDLLEVAFLAIFCLAQSTTSFIAEEQVLSHLAFAWIFFAWFAVSFHRQLNRYQLTSALAVLSIHRISVSWSNVGTLWRSSASISDYLKSHEWIRNCSTVLALLVITWKIASGMSKRKLTTLIALGVAVTSIHISLLEK